MSNDQQNPPSRQNQPHYRWPWVVLAGLILAIILAVFWMSKEFNRARIIREMNSPGPGQGSLRSSDASSNSSADRP